MLVNKLFYIRSQAGIGLRDESLAYLRPLDRMTWRYRVRFRHLWPRMCVSHL